MKNNDVHYCPFCERDRLLTDWGTCSKCGRDFVEGMDEDKLLEIVRGYRELVKFNSRLIRSDSACLRPALRKDEEDYTPMIAKIREYAMRNSVDHTLAMKIMSDFTDMLTEEC
jgi:hypothetical protein